MRSPAPGPRVPSPLQRWLAPRAVPAVGSALFVAVVANYALWWLPVVHHVDAWWVAGDFWHTYFATAAFVHGDFAAVYARHTGDLVTFPGILAVLSLPVLAVQGLHLSIGVPYTAVSTPTAWLALMPVDLAAGCTALFAADAVARRLAVPARRRAVLCVAEAVALWDLLAWQWHPEDAFAVALALWAVLALCDGRWRAGGWLLGAGVAFQPLVLLALVPLLARVPARHRVRTVVRAALPAAALVLGPLLAAPRTTVRALVDQPNSVVLDHPTPWVHLAPRLGGGLVAAGPARLVAVAAAAVIGWVVCRRTARPEVVLWTVAACFATRSVFESVMVAYYIWPALAVALVVAARASVTRLLAAGAVSSFATVLALHDWRGDWLWWSLVVGAVVVVVLVARPAPVAASPHGASPDGASPDGSAPAPGPSSGLVRPRPPSPAVAGLPSGLGALAPRR